MKVWRLTSRLWVPKTPEEVFPFFAAAENLERLTPPWLSFRILTPTPIDVRLGTLIDYRIALRGLPMKWRTRIARWQPPHAFADEQLKGPYALWHHTHTFEAHNGGTVLSDEVRMRPRGGPLAGLLMRAFVRRDVERIFRFRAGVMAALFDGREDGAQLGWTTLDRDPAGAPQPAS